MAFLKDIMDNNGLNPGASQPGPDDP